MEKQVCRWIVREGTSVKYWAFTPCKKGFNPLTKVSKMEHIKPEYDGRQCPICRKPIECDLSLLGVYI